ncbi:MAG: 4Fe-4S binding protein [Clostridiales bacterium]|jgi:carbon-monoxide dehydrogenase iron sulfur subunit|nr:4Fe-4S binding protein [Clostridiales bacterium]
MKKIKVNEKWCLACHLCEYYCAFANSGKGDMVKALQNRKIFPRITVEENDKISLAVPCRHCDDAPCVKACISSALSVDSDGLVQINKDKCVSCFTCVLVCPYGALSPGEDGVMQKCELCQTNGQQEPACVAGCPNRAIEYKEAAE